MRIAIQGHFERCKEVIDTLINLGGINKDNYIGDDDALCYYINECKHIEAQFISKIDENFYKCYTIEEFEKEFPFTIGDKVVFKKEYDTHTHIHTITGFEFYRDEFCYLLDYVDYLHYSATKLELYQPMKEERNITLTLDKAKEWYQRGGELKEVALQAFTEKELNSLPKSWEEYCKMYPSQASQSIFIMGHPKKYIALWKLEQLRDCYRQGWKPDWTKNKSINSIFRTNRIISIAALYSPYFLSFQSKEVAEEFLKNFEHLIRETDDLI